MLGKGNYLFSTLTADKNYRFDVYTHFIEMRDGQRNYLIKDFQSEKMIQKIVYGNQMLEIRFSGNHRIVWNLLSDGILENGEIEVPSELEKFEVEGIEEREYLMAVSENFIERGKNGVVFLREKPLGWMRYQKEIPENGKPADVELRGKTLIVEKKEIHLEKLVPGDREMEALQEKGIRLGEGFLMFSPGLKAWMELLSPEKWEENDDLQTLETLTFLYPQSGVFWYQWAKKLIDQEKYSLAEESLKKALERSENQDKIRETLGILYFFQEKYREAGEILKESGTAQSNFYRAAIFFIKKKYTTALYFFEQTIKKDPSYYKAYNNMALIYRIRKQYQRAENILRKGIEKNPENSDLYYNLGIVQEDRKKEVMALLAYEKAYELNSENLEAVNRLYYLYVKLNQEQKALRLLKKVLKKYPKDPISHYNLALLYEKRGNYPLAVFHFNAFLSFSEDDRLKRRVEYQLRKLLKEISQKN
jgi:tetratricopeptide (TPR) repeat protein